MSNPKHEDIVSECEGCERVLEYYMGGRFICACHPFPRMKWLCGYPCDTATHIKKDEETP